MELYSQVSQKLSEQLTKMYSTSFSMSSRLFARDIRSDIYSIYGLVRIADEIVDTYRGADQLAVLDRLEADVADSYLSGYSSNPIIHAYIQTARRYDIGQDLLKPFFASMRIDARGNYTPDMYDEYIYGSAEVVGLMCLRVFCDDAERYDELAAGARALGRAYQKVNFLRDIKADYEQLGRVYFMGIDYQHMTNRDVAVIASDIQQDFAEAKDCINRLPGSSRPAVVASALYYHKLLDKLESSDVESIKSSRLRVSNIDKLWLLVKATVWSRL